MGETAGGSTTCRLYTIVIASCAVAALSVSGYYLWRQHQRASPKIRKSGSRDAIEPLGRKAQNALTDVSEEEETDEELSIVDQASVVKGKELKNQGNTLFAQKQYDDAIAVYTEALSLLPTKHEERALVYANRAACRLNQQDYEAVIADCDRALKLDPLYQKALDRRGRAYEGQQRIEAALEDYMLVAMISGLKDASLTQRIEKLLNSHAEATASKTFNATRVVSLAEFPCRDFFDSFSPIPTALENERDAPDTFKKAIKSLQLGDFSSALGHFKACVAKDLPKDEATAAQPETLSNGVDEPVTAKDGHTSNNGATWPFFLHNYYGTLLFIAGKIEQANLELEEAIRCAVSGIASGDVAEVLIKQAFLAFEKGAYEEGIKKMTEAGEKGPANPFVAFHKAEIYMLIGEGNAALDAFEACIKMRGDFLPAYIHKSQAFVALGQLDQAERLMKKVATKLFPERADAMVAYGETLLLKSDIAAAESWFLKALSVDPKNVNALINLAILPLSQAATASSTDLRAVKEYLDRALAVDPACTSAHLQLANYHLLMLDFSSAEQHFNQAISSAKTFQECVNMIVSKKSSLMQAKITLKFPHLALKQ